MRLENGRRRPGASTLVALLAIVAVVWLNVVPHRHADESSERSCPACQVARGGGAETSPTVSTGVARPPVVSRLVDVRPVLAEATSHGAPLPGRSPPAPLS